MPGPLQVLLAKPPTADEAFRLARLLSISGAGPSVMLVVGQLLRLAVVQGPNCCTPIDNLIVVHRSAPRPNGEPVTLATLADADMVLIGLYGTKHGGMDEGTFSAHPTAGRTEAEVNEAVHLALAAIKAEMPSDVDKDKTFILYAGCPIPTLGYIKRHMSLLWEDHPYDLVVADHAVLQFGVRVGSSWVDDETGETFVIGRIQKDDVKHVISAKTVEYDQEYVEFVTQTYPFTELNCMIRAFPKGIDPATASHEQGEPVSWVVTHHDLSSGLSATRDKYRRRKLAAKCIEIVIQLEIEFMRKHGTRVFGNGGIEPMTHGYVRDGNFGMLRMLESCGFRKVEGGRLRWIGIKLSSI
ncbi:hypothetical protein HK105_203995 [Polyrhizophydium stewartii]|uniref:N-acetyltransferase domain-containing protein n=1 Tax=Polyrhizophydium stewartii TaxID=2732419 RepID=A0ABR4NAM6_9FUNG